MRVNLDAQYLFLFRLDDFLTDLSDDLFREGNTRWIILRYF